MPNVENELDIYTTQWAMQILKDKRMKLQQLSKKEMLLDGT